MLRHLQQRVNARDWHVHFVGDFLRRGFSAQLLGELLLRAPQFVHDLDHVHRNADRPGLIGDRACDGLANPPDGISRELIPAAVLEFFDAFHQPDVAFLDQVEE